MIIKKLNGWVQTVSQATWVHIPDLPPNLVTLGKLLNLRFLSFHIYEMQIVIITTS